MIDVHPPHEPVHGVRDFLIHLLTITIGLLIALSLEGYVEWQHHRNLVHEAEASLRSEIQENESEMQDAISELHKQQATLKQDVAILKQAIQEHGLPKDSSLDVSFHIRSFENVNWKTAQSTGALSYMPYASAQEYSDIYGTQDELGAAEQQAARDTIVGLAPWLDISPSDPQPTTAELQDMKQRIEILQGQLLLVDSLLGSLDKEYKRFLAVHPA
jgi:hypothetical protein